MSRDDAVQRAEPDRAHLVDVTSMTGLSAMVGQLDDTAQAFLTALGAAEPGSVELAADERRRVLTALDHTITVLTSARGALLVAERESGAWRAAGDASFEAWLGRTSRTGTRAATTQVRQAQTYADLPQVQKAAAAGQLTAQHVDALAKVRVRAPEHVREAMRSASAQAELVGMARRVDADTFARSAARWVAEHDATAHEHGHQAQRAARFLHLTDTADGTRISGLLDTVAGHRLRLALETAGERPAADDERTSEQRWADALDALSETVLRLPETGSGAAVRPHVSFVMTDETWSGLRAHYARVAARGDSVVGGAAGTGPGPAGPGTAGPAAVAGTGAGAVVGAGAAATLSIPPVTLEDGTPVPLSEVGRALCDCELTRIVVDADGVPMDLGRSRRTYTGAQRRAVIVRDRHCVWRGCDRHARWCEVHHLRWWDRDDGPTSVENGVLLCSFHHHEVHRRDLSIERGSPGPDGPTYTFHAPGGGELASAA